MGGVDAHRLDDVAIDFAVAVPQARLGLRVRRGETGDVTISLTREE